LRVVTLEGYSEKKLSSLLQETARKLLTFIYFQDGDQVQALWGQLYDAEQKEIRVAQNRLAESLILHVRQLGLHGHTAISDVLSRFTRAGLQLAELQDLPSDDAASLRRAAEAEKTRAQEQIKRMLE